MPAPLCVFLKCLLQQEEGGGLPWLPLCFFVKICCSRRKMGERGGNTMAPLVFFWQNLLQEEEEGRALCFFSIVYCKRRKRGGRDAFVMFLLKVCCPRH
jgi:hypothetical protein